jgi:hypothetical protein
MTAVMNNSEIVQLFLNAQDLLHVNGDRMQLLPLRDMETLAKLCGLVEQINPGRTPADFALVWLACTTAAALTTAVVDAPPTTRPSSPNCGQPTTSTSNDQNLWMVLGLVT